MQSSDEWLKPKYAAMKVKKRADLSLGNSQVFDLTTAVRRLWLRCLMTST